MDRRVSADAGFTLIELMISIAVLAALATSVTLSISRPGSDNTRDATAFQDLHERLQRTAVTSQSLVGLALDDTGYQRLAWTGDWVTQGPDVGWRGDVILLEPRRPDVVLRYAPSGQSTPFLIRFSAATGSTLCRNRGWGALECRGG